MQRYGGWIWSGDVQSRWATLAAHVPVGVNYSLSLTPFWGTDTGGFVPTTEFTGELYVRWFQFSAFNPLFRSHGRTWKLRLPWGWNTGEPGPVETNLQARPGRAAQRRGRADLQEVPRAALPAAALQLHADARGVRHRPAADAGAVAALPRRPGGGEARRRVPVGPRPARRPGDDEGRAERKLYLPEGDWYDFWTNEKQAGRRER